MSHFSFTLAIPPIPPGPPAPAPQPPGLGPNALLADGWPARILGCYWETWRSADIPLLNIPSDFNVIYLFNGRFNVDGSVNFPINAGSVTVPILQTLKNRGQKCILTMGGAGLAYSFPSRTESTNFVNSVVSLINNTYGGLIFGIDWDNYEGLTSVNFPEMVWASQQLRTILGPTFAITTPPGAAATGGTPINGRNMGVSTFMDGVGSMKDAGVLNWVGPQYYDDSFYKTTDAVKQINDRWTARCGETQTAVALGANYNFANATTLAESTDQWDKCVAAHPNQRGLVCWNIFTDVTTTVDASDLSEGAAEGNNLWGSTMRARLNSLYPPAPPPAPAVAISPLQGVNLSMMEADANGVRRSPSTRVNIDFTVPRAADLSYLASQGFGLNRLAILWELVQPVLVGSPAATSVLTAYGITSAGQMQPKVMGWILDVLDAAQAAGVKVILDLHNSCRYTDFIYQVGGTVTGFNAGDSVTFPYTTDPAQIIHRIMATAAEAAPNYTITQTHFNNFWTNFVNYVEAGTGRHINGHPGIEGYGLMNDPHDMPAAGSNVAGGFPEDKTIWNSFAQGAINAIRVVDTTTKIYVAGNDTEIPWTGNPGGSYLGNNPSYPLTGTNLVYEAHFTLDALDSGSSFDWATEAARSTSLGQSSTTGMTTATGQVRAQYCVDFTNANTKPMALTAVNMPNNDTRWQTNLDGAVSLLYSHNIGHCLFGGGNHWLYQGATNGVVPGFKQGVALLPLAWGVLHKAAARTLFTIFADADTNWGAAGTVCTVTLYTRGYSPSAIPVTLTKAGTGTLSAASATIPLGANQSVTFTYTTAGTEDATVTFSGATVLPGVMHFYSMDPVTYAATDKTIAGRACLAKYKAIEWLANNAYTDYLQGVAAISGQTVRAIHNSGFGENYFSSHGAKAWINATYGAGGAVALPTLALDASSHKNLVFNNSWGLWDRKTVINDNGNVDPSPVTVAPYKLSDSYFYITGISIASVASDGVIFAANNDQASTKSQLSVVSGAPSVTIVDAASTTNTMTSVSQLTFNAYHVLSLTSAPGAQSLRADKASVATLALTPNPDEFNSLSMGFIFDDFYPTLGFIGSLYGAITGKGAPTTAEMAVMEDYLSLVTVGTVAPTGAGGGGGGGGGATGYPSGVAALSAWLDPSTISTLKASSVSGGTVTGVGSFVGEMDSTSPATVNLQCPDATRFVLRQDGSSHNYLDTGVYWQATGGGGSTTAFFFAAAVKILGAAGGNNQFFFIDTDLTAGAPISLQGYEIFLDFGSDIIAFEAGNGTARTHCFAGSGLVAGPAFVMMAWDDGTNLNLQINNGTVVTAARPAGLTAGNINPILWAAETDGSQGANAANYGLVWAKNSALNSTDRAGIKTYLGAKIGLTL